MKIYTDIEIDELICEVKRLPTDYLESVRLKPKPGHKEREFDVTGDKGNLYKIILRVSATNPLAFSIVLSLVVPLTNLVFRLRRYDGKYHEHTNKIEKNKFYDFHIHYATERYQNLSGADYVGYAEIDHRYADYYEAMKCLFDDCGFIYPPSAERNLFDGV